MNYPPFFIEKLADAGIDAHALYDGFLPAKYVRANLRKTTTADLVDWLADEGYTTEPVSWHPGLLRLVADGPVGLGTTTAFREGRFYIQDVSSVVPVLALDPRPGQRILDLAAAPGGKTALICELTAGDARVTAVEKSPRRAARLKAFLNLHGIEGVDVVVADGRKKRFHESFDCVLVDAPCSTEGKIAQLDDALATHWTSWKKIKRLATIQKGLIRNGFRHLAAGGRLVYATCSFPEAENEDVVRYVLKHEPGARLVQPRLPPGIPLREGTLPHTFRTHPAEIDGNGGFLTVIEKRITSTKTHLPADI